MGTVQIKNSIVMSLRDFFHWNNFADNVSVLYQKYLNIKDKMLIYTLIFLSILFDFYLLYSAIFEANTFWAQTILFIEVLVIALFIYFIISWFITGKYKMAVQKNPFINEDINLPNQLVEISKTSSKVVLSTEHLENNYYGKLKPSTLNADEIKKQWELVKEKNYFADGTTFSQFEDLLNLRKPTQKIIWKPLFQKRIKNRRLLQEFLNNNLFQDQLILNNLLTTKEMCEFVNTYFELNEEVHKEFENPLNTDNVRDWRTFSMEQKKYKA